MRTEISNQVDISVNSSVNKLRRDVLTYAPAILIPAFLGLINIMFYTRLFTPNEYGQYSLVLTTTIFVATFMTQWIQQSVQKYRPHYLSENSIAEFNVNLKYLFYSVISVVILIGLVILLLSPITSLKYSTITISLLIVTLHMMYTLFSVILQSSFKSNKFRTYNLLNSFIKTAVPLLLIFTIYKDINMIFLGIIIGYLMVLIPMGRETGVFYSGKYKFNVNGFKNFTKSFVVYGFPMIGWFLGNSLLNLLDRYMLQSYWDDGSVGIYTATYSIVSASLGLFCTPLLMAAHPIIMTTVKDDNDDEITKVITRFSNIYLIIIFPAFILLTVLRNEVISLLLGPEFQKGSIIFPLMLLGLLLWNFGMYGHKGFEIKNKTKLMLLFVAVCVILNVGLNFILIPTYSYLGAAVASTLSLAAYPIQVYFFSKKTLSWKLRWRSIFNIVISSLIASLVIIIFKNMIPAVHYLEIIMCSIIFIIVYTIGLLSLKEVSKENFNNTIKLSKLKIKGE